MTERDKKMFSLGYLCGLAAMTDQLKTEWELRADLEAEAAEIERLREIAEWYHTDGDT
jgi:hypothetical protein